jgi:tetratricopeptide (TPR) repeat protein
LDKEPIVPAQAPAPPDRSAWERLSFAERAKIAEEVQRLDDLSNGALDAIEAKRYEEAERLCADLFREYPDVIDGHDRMGMLREAQGRFQEAADHYAKAMAIIEQHAGEYAPEVSVEFRRRRDEALARVAPQP